MGSVNELAMTCARSANVAEWAELLRRCTPIATAVAARTTRLWTGAVNPAIVEEIVQDVLLKLCEQDRRILREFRPRGEDSFLALIRVMTASVANDYFRRETSEKRGGKVVTTPIEEETSQARGSEDRESIHRMVLFAEIDRALRSAEGPSAERDRTLFWLYYLQGLTAEEIAELPGIGLTAKGVESALRRVVCWLRKELEHAKIPAKPVEPAGEAG